eukprot:Skav208702  [mRNA]  locus=scaffold42:357739:358542:+ [translate_table: standard]
MELHLVKQQLVRSGYIPVQLRAPRLADILAEALLTTIQADMVLPGAIGYTFWGRVHLQRLSWLVRMLLYLLCQAIGAIRRIVSAVLFLLQLNLNYARRFQLPLPGEHIMERILTRRTALGFALRLVILSLRDNRLIPLDILHVLMSGLFLTEAWALGETWILSCSLTGVLQLLSVFFIFSSLSAMLPGHKWIDLQKRSLPREVKLHLPSQNDSLRLSESEAALKILLVLEALERDGIQATTSFTSQSVNVRLSPTAPVDVLRDSEYF